ncbi:MAG: hypothetical protein LAT82_04875 [Nanoarchaeota archaeon]|nr:hypothetical protein [Nanoarchaeota archaeon]
MKSNEIKNINSLSELEEFIESEIKNFIVKQNIIFQTSIDELSSIVNVIEIKEELLHKQFLNSTLNDNSSKKSSLENSSLEKSQSNKLSLKKLSNKITSTIEYNYFKFKYSIPLKIKGIGPQSDNYSLEFLEDTIDKKKHQLLEVGSMLEFELLQFETILYELKNSIKSLQLQVSFSSIHQLIISTKKQLQKQYSILNTLLAIFINSISKEYKSGMYEEYHTTKDKILKIKDTSLKHIIHLETKLFDFFQYTYSLEEELNSLPKISLKDVQRGDIIVEYIEKEYSHMLGRVISFFLKTPIIHVSVVYKISNRRVYIFETSTLHNIFKSKIILFEKIDNIRYIVLRAASNLSKNQLEIFDSFVDSHISTPYAPLKTTGLVYKKIVHSTQNLYYFSTPSLKNPIKSKNGLFCSELISKLYLEMGIKITKLEDSSLVSPLDIYNSKNLKKIGILDL